MQYPTELIVTAALMLMAATLWMPYIIGLGTDPAQPEGFIHPPDQTRLRPWVRRAFRAHLNLLEQGVPFAILVLILDRIGAFTALTGWTAIAFLGLRVAHAAGMITGVARMPLRPILFSLGWVCCLIMGYAVFAAI